MGKGTDAKEAQRQQMESYQLRMLNSKVADLMKRVEVLEAGKAEKPKGPKCCKCGRRVLEGDVICTPCALRAQEDR